MVSRFQEREPRKLAILTQLSPRWFVLVWHFCVFPVDLGGSFTFCRHQCSDASLPRRPQVEQQLPRRILSSGGSLPHGHGSRVFLLCPQFSSPLSLLCFTVFPGLCCLSVSRVSWRPSLGSRFLRTWTGRRPISRRTCSISSTLSSPRFSSAFLPSFRRALSSVTS